MEVTKTMTIGEVVKKNEGAAEILVGFGMNSARCPSSQKETIEEACMVHGLDVDELLKKLAVEK